jgi:aminoglycoside phosphotransferase (APT) family kinase protein
MTQAFQGFKSNDAAGLIDEALLASWLDDQGLAPDAPLRVRRISGGMSNESIGLERGDQHWVLRRPAKNALEGADRGMQREFRVLSALEGSAVPHPTPLALCNDPAIAGCVFYVMEHVDGLAPGLDLREPLASDATLQHQVAMSCMQSLGELARVDWRERGLEGYGKPDGFHERQVSRWSGQLESYQARDLSGLREVGAWLDEHKPAADAWTAAIMHGDYHTGNVLVAPDPPGRVAAILDWENATIGDPLLDLAGFLRMFETSGYAHWAPRDEMIACWEQHSGRRAPELRYYTALSAYKLSVMLEGVYQRSLADPTRGNAEDMGKMVLRIMREAQEAIRG